MSTVMFECEVKPFNYPSFCAGIKWHIASGCQESPTMLSTTSTGTDLRSISLVAVAKLSLCQTMPSQFSPTDKLSIALRSISASRLQTPSQFWCTSQSHVVFAHLPNNGIHPVFYKKCAFSWNSSFFDGKRLVLTNYMHIYFHRALYLIVQCSFGWDW